MTLFIFNSICLQKFAIHIIELNKEVLIKWKHYFSEANFVNHHERDLIFFVI